MQQTLSLYPHFLSGRSVVNMSLYFIPVCVLVFCGVVVLGRPQTGSRPAVSDEDINSSLQDKRYLMRQLKCALGEAPCDPVGRRLKSLAPLVLRGSCPQCSPQEMRQIQKVLGHVQKNYPKEWNKILQQYAG